MRNPNVFKMAANIDFSKNYKKISFADISEISPKRDIKCHLETIENLKNSGNFPESCPLTIIPRARMGSESMRPAFGHEAEGRKGYCLRDHEGERNNCFSKIQLAGQKYCYEKLYRVTSVTF